MKIGLDIHGVLDHPIHGPIFSIFSHDWIMAKHEVHVITGEHWTKETEEKLRELGVAYTHHFSISDYHKEIKTPMTYRDPENPFLDSYLWDRTKADYCRQMQINIHFDDSPVYGQYFKGKTTYIKIG